MTTPAMGRRWTCECVGGREVTRRDRGAPLTGSTWLGKGDGVGATARPPVSLRCSPDARWSTGVIMYTLLAGSPPFWHRKQMLMLRMIMSGNYQFGSPEWDDYSDTVKDLVRGRVCWLPGSGKGQVQCWCWSWGGGVLGVGGGVVGEMEAPAARETPA